MRLLVISRTVFASLGAVVLIGVAFVACQGGGSPTAPEAPAGTPAPTKSLSSDSAEPSPGDPGLSREVGALPVQEKAAAPKVEVCHRPPDNPGNHQIITVGQNAVAAHLAHGDNIVGAEVCDGVDNDCNGTVDDGGDALCDDGVGCTSDICNGAAGCANVPDDADCDNGFFCDGMETCDPVLDCQDGTPVDCDDAVGCTDDSCNESTDSCDSVANDANCDDGMFCNGAETCDEVLDCQDGTPVDCDDAVGCTDDSCNEDTDACDNVANDASCDNGLFCDGVETCDPVLDCQPGGGDPCAPGETCVEPDQCVPAAVCGDGNVDPGEQCDDGNNVDGDGCDSNCQVEMCMDSVLDCAGPTSADDSCCSGLIDADGRCCDP